MWKGLFDGITVPPSVGRRQKTSLPIPEVIGTDITESEQPPPQIEVETKPAVVDPLESTTIIDDDENLRAEFQIDLTPYFRVIDAEPPYRIRMIGVKEYSESRLAGEWDPENRFASIDKHGILTYRPRGNYLRNALALQLEIVNEDHPALGANNPAAEVYDPNNPNPGRLPIGGVPLDQHEMVVQMIQNNLGLSREEASKFWQNQGMNPTCALAAVSSILLSLGKNVDYNTLLEQATTEIFFDNGDTLYRALSHGPSLVEENLPELSDEFWQVVSQLPDDYFEWYGGRGFDPGSSGKDDWLESMREYIEANQGTLPSPATHFLWELYNYRTSDDYDGHIVEHPDSYTFNADSVSQSWDAMQLMFEHNDVTPRMGVGSDFSTVLQEILAGNPIIAAVDSKEFDNWRIHGIQDQQDRLSQLNRPQDLDSRANHAVWITGIEFVDGVPYVVVIDSAAGEGVVRTGTNSEGGAQLYSLDHFAAAWEDSDYAYMSVGEVPQVIQERTAERQAISDTLEGFFNSIGFDAESAEYYATTDFLHSIQDKTLIETLDLYQPGTREKITTYLENVENDRQALIEETGIDPDVVTSIFEEVDVEEAPP